MYGTTETQSVVSYLAIPEEKKKKACVIDFVKMKDHNDTY